MKIYPKWLSTTIAFMLVLTGCGDNTDDGIIHTKGEKSLEAAVETCVKAMTTGDDKGVLEIAPPGVVECMSESLGLTGDRFMEEMTRYTWSNFYKENPSSKVDVVKTEPVSTDILSQINQAFSANGYEMADDIVEAIYNITFDKKFAESEGLDSPTLEERDGIYVLKINGKWYASHYRLLEDAVEYWEEN